MPDRRQMRDAGAASAGTPCAASPEMQVAGHDTGHPTIISEKNTPIDSTIAGVLEGGVMPAPRPVAAGRLFIIAARLGEANRPSPTPFSSSRTPNTQ